MTKQKEEKTYRHYAAIDVGTNAVRLLIKRFEKNGKDVYSSKEQLIRVPLRLGFEVFRKNRISKMKEKELTKLMRSFSYMMKIYDVSDYMACATSALRDAENGRSIVKRIVEKTGIQIEILNGQQEAKGIYNSYATNDNTNCMFVDVGGGSTEISVVNQGNVIFSKSYNIGTIRILCDVVSDKEWKRMEDDMQGLSELYTDIKMIGSGGNINKLYRLIDSRDKKQQRITVKSLSELFKAMNNMSVEERVHTYGLRYDRADVIVPASVIFLTIADILKSKYIYVPTIGLSDGIVNKLFEDRKKKYGCTGSTATETKAEPEKEKKSAENKDNAENETLNEKDSSSNFTNNAESIPVETQEATQEETAETSD